MEEIIMKKTRILLALIVVLALCMSLVPIALATTPSQPITAAAITKKLQVPIGTEYPAMGFVFTVTPYMYNTSTLAADLLKLPVIGTPAGGTRTGEFTINFNGAMATPRAETLEGTVANVSTYYLESGNIFAGITFPNAGEYKYIIAENRTTYNIASQLHESLVISPARYEITAYVRENNGVPYIYHIGAVRITTEGGTPGTEKVNPTPGGDRIDTFYSQMSFVNRYVRTNGAPNPDNPDPKKPDPGDPDTGPGPGTGPSNPGHSTLNISKLVKGELGSLTLPFMFAVRIDVPTLIPTYVLSSYKAYLVDSTGVLDPNTIYNINTSLIGTDTTGNGYKYIRFTPGEPVHLRLKSGQSLVFVNTPVGTTYTVTETAEAGYDTFVTTWYNNTKNATVTSLTAAGYVGERFNEALYVNDTGNFIPGGLNVNDLPFYGLILLAVGGLALYIVIKARKRNRG